MSRWIKRFVDVVAALVGLVALSPLLVVVSLVVLVNMGRPIFFRQTRPGHHGRSFDVVKFRTLRQATVGDDGEPLDTVDRLTRLGAILRRASIDEIPQLWNVLRGDMSLVGPRPLLVKYMELYTPEQARRHDVPPGITGWAQVNGRQAIDFEQRFAYDVWYVDHWSLRLDLKILGLTFLKLIRPTDFADGAGLAEPAWAGGKTVTNRETQDWRDGAAAADDGAVEPARGVSAA